MSSERSIAVRSGDCLGGPAGTRGRHFRRLSGRMSAGTARSRSLMSSNDTTPEFQPCKTDGARSPATVTLNL